MKKQDMLKLAIVGMMAGASVLGAQGTAQKGTGAGCNGVTPPPANGQGTTQQAPKSDCSNKTPDQSGNPQASSTAKKRGVDTSIRSSYSSSNQQNASKNRAYEAKCGQDSCDNVPPPAPQPGTGSAKVQAKRSSSK